MISIFRKNTKRILLSLVTNPILIIVYGIFGHELVSYCKYGRMNNNIYILLLCVAFFIAMITFTTMRVIKDKEYESKKTTNSTAWKSISIIIIVVITSFYGVQIYKSATNYNSKLARFIERFKHNNIHKSSKEKDVKKEKEQFFLSKEVGYKLDMIDKALGSAFYSLSKTSDGGKTWEVINTDPFNRGMGSISGITFINDKLGFLGAFRPSGNEGELYRTDDGGLSFKKVDYPPHEVKSNHTQSIINPFDSPGIPYEKDGVLNMVVGQGGDGDYNGDSSALYQSKDKGETWEFIEEVKKK